jgi:hypothetical protein
MYQEMDVTTVAASVNYSLVGVLRSEPSAVEHGLPLLVALHVLQEVVVLGHLAVQEEQPPQAVSVAQGY